jgi:hypothetical protein
VAALLVLAATAFLPALSPLPLPLVALVSGAMLAALGLGSSLPLLVHLYVRPLRYRPEPRQWRWGATCASALLLLMSVVGPNPDHVLTVGSICLNGLYAAGKAGCAKFGCCQAVPYRVVNASVSLPAFETTVALSVFLLCIVLALLGEYRMAIASGISCHCMGRAISYWARGTNPSLRHPLTTPDVYALLALILTYPKAS